MRINNIAITSSSSDLLRKFLSINFRAPNITTIPIITRILIKKFFWRFFKINIALVKILDQVGGQVLVELSEQLLKAKF